METSEITNPYVGPAAFRQDQGPLFFGRDREAKKLLSLISADEVVLFYSPSGAGKTSLVNARIIPELKKKGVEVLPVARVGGEVPLRLDPKNIYVFNLLSYLAGKSVEDSDAPEQLEDVTLRKYLEYMAKGAEKVRPQVLVLDQFEEIMTTHPEHREKREDFFYQVRDALDDNPFLSMVFVMREDHIASLDRYVPLLPGHLSSRFRMDRLQHEAAVIAVRRPAEKAGRPFAENVAEALVDNLRQERLAQQEKTIAGEFVEPVQLQVVCFQLWESLRDRPVEWITEADLEGFGGVDRALESFYEEIMERVAGKSGLPEIEIRRFFEKTLITPARIRGQVNQEPEKTGGLPNEAVNLLLDEHLVRAEEVRGGTWYELVHDRFIEPILASNKRWMSERRSPLAAAAEEWKKSGCHKAFLYQGKRLEKAAREVEAYEKEVGKLGKLEEEFLEVSREVEERRRARRRMITMAASATLLTMGSLIFASYQNKIVAVTRENATVVAATGAEDPLVKALLMAELKPAREPLNGLRAARQVASAAIPAVVLRGHGKKVGSVAFSPDGTRVLTGSADGTARVWNADGSGSSRELAGLGGEAVSVAWSPDGTRVAVGSANGQTLIWEPDGERPPRVLAGHRERVRAVAWNLDGTHVLTGSHDGTVRLWNMDDSGEYEVVTDHEALILGVAFTSDGRPRFQSMGGESTSSESKVLCVAWSRDGARLATGSANGMVRIWSGDGMGPPQTFAGHESGILGLAWSHDGTLLATGSADGKLRLWSAERPHKLVKEISEYGGEVLSLAFSPKNTHVLGGLSDKTARIWPLASVEPLEVSGPAGSRGLEVAFRPDGAQSIFTLLSGDETRIWNLDRQGASLLGKAKGEILSADLSPDGTRLVTASDDGTIRVWATDAKSSPRELGRCDSEVWALALSPEGRAASGSADGAVRLWSPDSPESPLELGRLEGDVWALAFNPDGGRVVSGAADGTVYLWSTDGSGHHRVLGRHEDEVFAVAFGPNGRQVASGAADGTVCLWNADASKPCREPGRHEDGVMTLAFSPDGWQVLSGAEDGTIRLWAADGSGSLLEWSGSEDGILSAAAFSPDAGRVLTALSDGTVQIWRVSWPELLDYLKKATNACLTPEQRINFLSESPSTARSQYEKCEKNHGRTS